MAEIKKRWYVVRAIGGKERKVKDYIDLEIKRHKLEHLVGQVLIPTEKVYQIRNGKKLVRRKTTFQDMCLSKQVLKGKFNTL